MDIFKHEPIDLEGPAFRLLRLYKGGASDIECELFQAWLYGDSTISYEALSYTWGGADMSASVKINGKTLGVTENLYLALQYLRSQETDRILWVDAICIDQSNPQERGHQVQQMGNIYSQADQVVIWLGSATHDTNVIMDSLKQLEDESLKFAWKSWNLTDKRWMDVWSLVKPIHWDLATRRRTGLELLLGRPWFKRVWILQEVANAKRAVVCSGTRSVSARIFALAPLLVGIHPEPHCQAVLDIMPGPSRQDSWWGQKRDLQTLLRKFSGSEASDPRDIIYALLGISSDARDTEDLRADYTKDYHQVVHDAASFLFGLSNYPYYTLSELVCNFASLNAAFFIRIAELYDASKMYNFLMQRGSEVTITEEVIKAVAKNTQSGKEIMELLHKQRGEEVFSAAAQSGEIVTALLLKQVGSQAKITEEVLKAAAGNTVNGRKVMALLLEQRGSEVKITEEVLKAAAGNTGNGKGVMDLLLQQRGSEVKITEEVLKAAAGNTGNGREVMALLLQQRGSEIKITEVVLKAAAGNIGNGRGVMNLLLRQRGSEVKITEKVLKAAAGNTGNGRKVMARLLEQRGSEVKITEEVLQAAAGNTGNGREVMALLLEQRGSEVKITEGVLKAAAGNTRY
jgi:uncharacterized membrane protein YkoI